MKKVSDLTGSELDFFVAEAEGKIVSARRYVPVMTKCQKISLTAWEEYSPSTDWSQGGPIIKREKIGILPRMDGSWYAEIPKELKQDGLFAVGETPLVAAMRCFVADKFGEEVEE